MTMQSQTSLKKQITNSEEIAGPEEVVKEAGEGEDEVREEGEKKTTSNIVHVRESSQNVFFYNFQ